MTTTVVMTDRDANSEKNQITEEMTEITQAFQLLQSKDRNHRERMLREKTITRRKIIVVMMKKECQRVRRKTSRSSSYRKTTAERAEGRRREIKQITIPEVLTIKELADKMKIVPSVIVKKLFMQGKIATVNQEIDYETAEEIALEFDVLCEKEEVVDVIEEALKEDEKEQKENEETSAGSLCYGSR